MPEENLGDEIIVSPGYCHTGYDCVILLVVGPGLYNSGVLDAHIWAGMQLLCSGQS